MYLSLANSQARNALNCTEERNVFVIYKLNFNYCRVLNNFGCTKRDEKLPYNGANQMDFIEMRREQIFNLSGVFNSTD